MFLPSYRRNCDTVCTRGKVKKGVERFELFERPELLSAPFTRRIVIRVGGFLRRSQLFWHFSEIHSNAGPGGRPATHGVDQHVVYGEKRGHFGMLTLPSFETGDGRFSVRRVGDHQKRRLGPWLLHGGFLFRGAGTRRLYARCFAFHLTKVWWPGCIAETGRLVFRR